MTLDKKLVFTGLYDEDNQPIYLGDRLENEWNYVVIVRTFDGTEYYGELVCDEYHSCKNIPYSLNNGQGYKKIK